MHDMHERIILGIDPGIGKTGFGVVRECGGDLDLLDYGCIETQVGLDRSQRLADIESDLSSLLERWRPHVCAVEKVFFAKNRMTAIDVSHARGVILLAIQKAGVQLLEYTPPEVKLAVTGSGSAEKYQVKHMVKTLLRMAKPPTPDDAADALAIALCGALHNNHIANQATHH